MIRSEVSFAEGEVDKHRLFVKQFNFRLRSAENNKLISGVICSFCLPSPASDKLRRTQKIGSKK